jgi:hypothetical protein
VREQRRQVRFNGANGVTTCAVFLASPRKHLREPELTLEDSERVLHLRASMLALPCSCFSSRCLARPSGSLAMLLGSTESSSST